MNQPQKKPAITATVAAAPKAPYTARREGKDRSVNGTEANEFAQGLDRRLTEGLNLLHGRLDVIQADVRENRGDIKELRKEVWKGFSDAAKSRGRLVEKNEFDRCREEMHQRFSALEESNRQIIAIVSRIQERSEATAWTRRRVVAAVAAGVSLLVIGALLQPLLERVSAALFGG